MLRAFEDATWPGCLRHRRRKMRGQCFAMLSAVLPASIDFRGPAKIIPARGLESGRGFR